MLTEYKVMEDLLTEVRNHEVTSDGLSLCLSQKSAKMK